jgi:hypothetical protein
MYFAPRVPGKEEPLDVLVPDDPVFQARFQSLEEPLLRRLDPFHGAGEPEEDERVLLDAYDGWVRVLVKLPRWPAEGGGDRRAGILTSGRSTYTLYGSRGNLLTSLYPVEVSAADLGSLDACLNLLAEADPDADPEAEAHAEADPEAEAHAEAEADAEADPDPDADTDSGPARPPAHPDAVADVLRRVVRVLSLPPPRRLLRALRHVVPRGPVVSVTLPASLEAEYRCFCEEFVTLLSAGDPAAYASHRAMYP